MNTLYQRTKELFDIAGNQIGWETKPVVFPDTFFLYSGLKFNWTDNTVTRNGKTYYLDKLVVNQELNIPTTDEWQSHYGNDIKFEYYTGDESETEKNPTGNTNNIKRAIYLSQGITKYILEYDYNECNKVIKISSLAPNDSITSGNEQQDEEIITDDTVQDLTKLKFAFGKELFVTDKNTIGIRPNERCIFVTRRKTKNPLLSDGIQPEENTGKIQISLTSLLYNVQCVAYNEQNAILYNSGVVQAVANTPTQIEVSNTYSTPIAYIAINLYYNDAESGIDEATVNQEDLGLTVTFAESINLVIRREGSTDIVRHLLKGDTVLYSSLPSATRENYEFDGWYIGESKITSDFVIDNNTVIEARYTRLYNLTKVNGSAQTITQIREGENVTLETLESPNLVFLGWYKDIDGNKIIQPNEFTMTEDVTLSAYFKARLIKKVDDVETSSDLYDIGEEITLDTLTMQGYEFDGWFAEGATEPTASPFAIAENTTLSARFTKIVTLTLYDGVDSANNVELQYREGTTVDLAQIEQPTRQEYNFAGWHNANDELITSLTITENTTITAQWTIIQYTVTLVNVDGRGLNTEDTITCDSGYSLSESEVKAKLDESLTAFVGCYTDSEYTEAVTFPYTVSGNITLYCKFQEIGG